MSKITLWNRQYVERRIYRSDNWKKTITCDHFYFKQVHGLCTSMGSSCPVSAILPLCTTSFPGIILKRYILHHDCPYCQWYQFMLCSQAMTASTIVHLFLILGLFFSSIGSLVVASILKKLDNVVKVNYYTILHSYEYKTKIVFENWNLRIQDNKTSILLFSGVQLLNSQHVHGDNLRPLLPWQVHHHRLHPLLHGLPVRGDILLWKENLQSPSGFKLLP